MTGLATWGRVCTMLVCYALVDYNQAVYTVWRGSWECMWFSSVMLRLYVIVEPWAPAIPVTHRLDLIGINISGEYLWFLALFVRHRMIV